MLSRTSQPIIAVATASGRGAVGIVRISGQRLGEWISHLLGRTLRPREATYLPFNSDDGQAIDHGLALFFPSPHSFTGEDVLELQGHGGPIVLQLLVARCIQAAAEINPLTGLAYLPDIRLANPGEFSERAFLNDKIDLAQAEAIADLIDASTEAAARSATLSLSGAFSKEIHVQKDALIRLRMLVEATLDFPEEEVDVLEKADATGQLTQLLAGLRGLLMRASQGALLRDGVTLVIAGQPNVGKSSLLNALAGMELAIVTPIAGTTRDKIQQTIQIEGVPIHIVDTAGLRSSDDEVERIGVSRAWDAIDKADAVLFLHDLTRAASSEYRLADLEISNALDARLSHSVPILDVWNKVDAASPGDVLPPGLLLSVKTGEGLDSLRHLVLESVGWKATGEGLFIARERHLQLLQRVQSHLLVAQEHFAVNNWSLDLMAEELRLAQLALGEVTGEFTSDDLLGVIFAKFCIGK